MSAGPSERLYAFDSFRGLAALLVVLYHYTVRYSAAFHLSYQPAFQLPWGQLGVQFFFMVSGFVIFMTLTRTKTGMDFAVSRFSRLYPAYWVAVLGTSAVVGAYQLEGQVRTPSEILVNLTMLQRFLGVPPVDGVYWTLAYELEFYVGMCMLFRFKLLTRIEFVLAGWIAVAVFAELCSSWFPWRLSAYLMLSYSHLFAAGILFYRVHTGQATRWTYLLIFACLANQAIVNPTQLVSSRLEQFGFVTVCFTLFYLAATGRAAFTRFRPLTFLGTISYTLYLIHENLGYVVLDVFRVHGISPNLAVPFALLLAMSIATAVTYAIERPAMRWIRNWYRSRTPYGTGVGVKAAPAQGA